MKKSDGTFRIGFDGRWYNRSGVGNFTLGLLNALVHRERNYGIVLFEHPWNPVPLESDGVERITVSQPRYSPLGQLELSRQIARHDVDLVHCPFYVAPFLARCPVVITIYDLIAFQFHLYGALKQAVVKSGYRAGVHKAAGIIVCSNRTAHDCGQMLGADPARITVAYAGCSPEFSSNIEPGELQTLLQRYGIRQPYVLLLGSRHWRTKGLGFALKALDRCKRTHDFQIVWAGADEALNEDPEAKEARVSDIVRCGFVANADLATLYRHASTFVLPSLYEGFGMPLLEAMSCGCPVVCSDGGSLPEVAGSGAVVVPHDLNRMSGAISSFLSDERLRNAQKKGALARAAEFSWTRSADKVLGLYEQILGLPSAALSAGNLLQEEVPKFAAINE